jgi:hypothetical protein
MIFYANAVEDIDAEAGAIRSIAEIWNPTNLSVGVSCHSTSIDSIL